MEDIKFHYQVEKVSGGKTDGHFCAVFSKGIEIGGSPGLLVGCIDGLGDGELSGKSHQLFELVGQRLEQGEGGILERFHAGNEDDLEFVFCFFYKGACYIHAKGQRVKLTVFGPGKSELIKIKNGSGPVGNDQVYLLANDVCFELFDFGVLTGTDYNLSDIVDGIATEVSAQGGKPLGAIFVKTREEQNVFENEIGSVGQEAMQPSDMQSHSLEIDANEGETVSYDGGPATQEESPKSHKRAFGILGSVLGELKGVFKGEKGAIGSFRKKLIFGVILLLVVLVASGSFTIVNRNKVKKNQQYEQLFTQANGKYQEALAIIELNKEKARGLLIEAGEDIKKAQLQKEDEKSKQLLADIEGKIKETEAGNVQIETFGEIEGGAVGLGFAGKNLMVVGKEAIWSIDSSGKAAKQSDGLKNAFGGTVFDNKVFYLDEDGVYRRDGNAANKVNGETGYLDVGVFFGNIYLLTGQQISKIVPIEGGYADPADYLDGKQDFGQDSRMAIDSMIWVTSGDKVFKFNRGKKESFEISGVPGKVGQLSLIYTDGVLSNLYVLDKENSVLLVFDKEGVYKKALQSSEFKNSTDIVVNEAEDTVYFASGSKILKVPLK